MHFVILGVVLLVMAAFVVGVGVAIARLSRPKAASGLEQEVRRLRADVDELRWRLGQRP